MKHLKEMNELDTGYEVVFIDENGDENSNIYDTYDKAIEFITTLQL